MRFLTAVSLLACSAVAQTAPPKDVFASHITANELKGDVSFLASDALEGRGTPSRGLDIAAEFIASQFRRAGLEPGAPDFFQPAAFESVTSKQAEITLAFEAGGKTIQVEQAGFTLLTAASVDLHSAPVVIAEDDAAFNALTPEQVRGKVLLLMTMRRAGVANLQPALVILMGRGGRGGGGKATVAPGRPCNPTTCGLRPTGA